MKSKTYLLPIATLCMIIGIIAFPFQSIEGAKIGLNAFLQSVLPTLLPFFVGTSILIRCGTARILARWLSPVMRPLFGIGGAGALAFVMSCISGYPNGARVASELYSQGLLSRAEARRTIVLSSTAGPSFVLAAVATQMLGHPEYGALLLCCHLLSAIAVCQIARIWIPEDRQKRLEARENPKKNPQRESTAQIFVESVRDAAVSLWGVGSFIIFFCTIAAVLEQLRVFSVLGNFFAIPLKWMGFSPALGPAMSHGVMEMTSGCLAVCAVDAPVAHKLPVLCAILSFGGACVMAQIHLFASQCGMRVRTLLLFKLFQGVIALGLCTLVLMLFPASASAFAPIGDVRFGTAVLSSMGWFALGVGFIFLLSAIMWLFFLLQKKRAPIANQIDR